MRLGGFVDDNESYKQEHQFPVDPSTTGENASTPEEAPPLPQEGGTPPPSETPSETPGPAGNPQGGQGGKPPQTPPSEPPQTGQGVGLVASPTTGGLEGSFAQAGTSDFARRFGGESPAVWFRNAASRGKGVPGGPNAGRGNAGGVGNIGGALPTESEVGAGSVGEQGGGKNDEEWQRFMREVSRIRFGRGGA